MIQRYNSLKSLLIKKNMTQQELADKINMPRQTLNIKINRYAGRDFTLDEAKAISNVLNEPIDKFF